MKSKTIKSLLSKKVSAWLESIEDEAVRNLVAQNTIVTGGCIASMLLGEDVNDFDIYFRNKDAALAIAQYYVARFEIKKKSGIDCEIYVEEAADYKGEQRIKIVVKSAGVASEDGAKADYAYFESAPEGEGGAYVAEVMQDPGAVDEKEPVVIAETPDDAAPYRPVFLSANAITLSGKMQLILRFYGDPEEIHKNYDFIHCTNYWCSWTNDIMLHKDALESLLSKELRYVGSIYPVCSLIRLRKFIKRGWMINAGQIVKMAFQISELDLGNVAVLEDQLTGVDVAYFVEVINKVKMNDPEKINAAYLCEIIDRMF